MFIMVHWVVVVVVVVLLSNSLRQAGGQKSGQADKRTRPPASPRLGLAWRCLCWPGLGLAWASREGFGRISGLGGGVGDLNQHICIFVVKISTVHAGIPSLPTC